MKNKELMPDVLLFGSLCALEQCGYLVTDAAVLLQQHRYSTASAIALLAYEELGRHQLLLDYWRHAANGNAVARAEVINAWQDNHVTKQRSGQSSLTYRMQQGDQLHQLLQTRNHSPIGSAERQAADEKIKLIDERKLRQQAYERHERRMQGLYVDLRDDDTWSRPCDLDRQVCADDVQNAINDYTRARLRIGEEVVTVYGDVQLAQAVEALANRPTTPVPPQPSLDVLLPPSKRA